MTKLLVDSLLSLDYNVALVEKRFSRSLEEVGHARLSKGLRILALAARARRTWADPLNSGAPCIYFLTNRPMSFLVDATLIHLAALMRVSVIAYVHTVGFDDLARRGAVWRLLLARTFGRVDSVVTLGSTLRRDIARWPLRVHIIPNAIIETAQEAPSSRGSEQEVLFYSNVSEEKGVFDFIDLAEEVGPVHPDILWTVAGRPTSVEVRASVIKRVAVLQQRGLRVRFLGPVDPRDRDRVLGSASLLIFPSQYIYEAQPLSIIEASAASVPTIAYDIGGVRDVVINGVSGYVVPTGDTRELQTRARQLLDDPALLARLAAGARDSYNSRHSATVFAASWDALLSLPPRSFASSSSLQ